MGVTIYDLAREAGVGIGTVSRWLNNHPNVSARTRAKIVTAAKRLNYQPHTYAQRLASRRTNTVAVIIPYFTSYFFLQVLQGVQDRAAELGLDLVLYGVNHPSQAEDYLRRSLQRGRVDGVLFFSMMLPEAYATKFLDMRLPLVLVDASHPHFDSIRVENREGAYRATSHLVRLGHRNLFMLNASLNTLPARQRSEGFAAALRDAGLSTDDRSVAAPPGKLDGFTRDAGFDLMRRVIDRRRAGDAITGVFVASDIQALGALEAARDAGVRVPADVAIVGFDDIELAQHAGLTTMRQPMYDMGSLAMRQLVERMQNPAEPPRLTTIVPELVVRASCGAAPAGVLYNSIDGTARPAAMSVLDYAPVAGAGAHGT